MDEKSSLSPREIVNQEIKKYEDLIAVQINRKNVRLNVFALIYYRLCIIELRLKLQELK